MAYAFYVHEKKRYTCAYCPRMTKQTPAIDTLKPGHAWPPCCHQCFVEAKWKSEPCTPAEDAMIRAFVKPDSYSQMFADCEAAARARGLT